MAMANRQTAAIGVGQWHCPGADRPQQPADRATRSGMLWRWPVISMPSDKSNQGEVSVSACKPPSRPWPFGCSCTCKSSAWLSQPCSAPSSTTSKPALRRAAKSLSAHCSQLLGGSTGQAEVTAIITRVQASASRRSMAWRSASGCSGTSSEQPSRCRSARHRAARPPAAMALVIKKRSCALSSPCCATCAAGVGARCSSARGTAIDFLNAMHARRSGQRAQTLQQLYRVGL